MYVIIILRTRLLSSRTKSKLESHKKVCENKDFSGYILVIRILEFNQYRKSEKILSINYADLESFIKRINECKSDFETIHNNQ